MTSSSRSWSSLAVNSARSNGTGSIRRRFSAYARTLRTICSVVWSTSCMGGLLLGPSCDHHDRHRGVPDDLRGPGPEEDAGQGPECARPHDQDVSVPPLHVVEGLAPVVA